MTLPARSKANRRDPMVAALAASAKVRDGRWIRGAPTHVLAEFLTALADAGWVLRYEAPVCKKCAGRGWRPVCESGRHDPDNPATGWANVTTQQCNGPDGCGGSGKARANAA